MQLQEEKGEIAGNCLPWLLFDKNKESDKLAMIQPPW